MRFALLALLLAGCADPHNLVAEYGPDRAFKLDEGSWVDGARLETVEPAGSTGVDMEGERVVRTVAGDHQVLRFQRDEDDTDIRVWIEVDGDRVVNAGFWAREWDGETLLWRGLGGSGTCRLGEWDGGERTGTLSVRLRGQAISVREGPRGAGDIVIHGPFRVERREPR
jgi:hypothetical protein